MSIVIYVLMNIKQKVVECLMMVILFNVYRIPFFIRIIPWINRPYPADQQISPSQF